MPVLNPNLYYRWSKEFLEAGKKRLVGDTTRDATSTEVTEAVVVEEVRHRHRDPRVGHIIGVGLGLLNLLGEQRLVDGAVVHVSQRYPSAG